jgi:hypothetical protein
VSVLMSPIGPKQTSASALHMSAFGGKADIGCAAKKYSRCTEKVLHFARNLLSHLASKMYSFAAKYLMPLKSSELPKLHTRVRFPSPPQDLMKFSRRVLQAVLEVAFAL